MKPSMPDQAALDELYAERCSLLTKKYSSGLTSLEEQRLEEIRARLDEEEEVDLEPLKRLVASSERLADEVRSWRHSAQHLRDTVECPGPLFGMVGPAESGILFQQRVGDRSYVAVWILVQGRWRWTLRQNGRLVALGSGKATSTTIVDRRILRDAGVLRVAWAWLTDRGKSYGLRGAVRNMRALCYHRDMRRHTLEMIVSPSPMFEWCIRDEDGHIVSAGTEATQEAAMEAMYKAAEQLEKNDESDVCPVDWLFVAGTEDLEPYDMDATPGGDDE